MHEWEKEILEATRREPWSLTGPNCIVKVVQLKYSYTTARRYITLGKYLVGKNPHQIQVALGLKKGHLMGGAKIFRFKRLPRLNEYEYELTTEFPDGLPFDPRWSSPDYLPGAKFIHQWQLKSGVSIPVDLDSALELRPGEIFPYDWLVE